MELVDVPSPTGPAFYTCSVSKVVDEFVKELKSKISADTGYLTL